MEFVLQDELTALSNADFNFPCLPLDEMDPSAINAALNGQSDPQAN